MNVKRSWSLTAAVLLLPSLVGVAVHLAVRDRLPASIPFPWDLSGGMMTGAIEYDPDAFWFANAFGWVCMVVVCLWSWWLHRHGSDEPAPAHDGVHRRIVGVGVAAAMPLALWVRTELAAYGATDFDSVQVAPWHTMLAGISIWAYAWLLPNVIPAGGTMSPGLPTTGLSFPPGTRICWSGSASSRLRGCTVATLAVGSVVVAVYSPSTSVAVLLLMGWLLWGYKAKVRIDNTGVTFSRTVGWPAFHLPLRTVTAASVRRVDVALFSDRIPDGLTVVDARSIAVRTGDALVIESVEHLPLSITVDGAQEAADVINALVLRSRSAIGRVT